MSASEIILSVNLQVLSDVELQAQRELIDAELKHRSERRLERVFQSFSHLGKQELATLKEKITDYLGESAIAFEQSISHVEKCSDFSDPTAGFSRFNVEDYQEPESPIGFTAEVDYVQEPESPTGFTAETGQFQEVESALEVVQVVQPDETPSQGTVHPIQPNLIFDGQSDFHLRNAG
jgi:ElaB/YqjD/DUF883 family membrane-anchored ribosome-binding protein